MAVGACLSSHASSFNALTARSLSEEAPTDAVPGVNSASKSCVCHPQRLWARRTDAAAVAFEVHALKLCR